MSIGGTRSRRSLARRSNAGLRQTQFIEQLEQRACPAAVSITGPAEVNETAGTAQIFVTLSEKVAAPVTVNYSLQSTLATATYGRDYRFFAGRSQVRPTGTLTFRAGQTSQVITVQLFDDTLREGNEHFTMALQGARNATLNPQAKALAVTIKDNDNYTVSIVGPATVTAGTTIEYRLQLSSPATQRETFYVSTRDGTAKVTQDYRPLIRVPVTILPGQSSALVRLVTVANPSIDYDKTVFIDIVPATPGFPAPTPPFTTTIPGPLGPRPVDISVADVTVAEGAAGTTTTANFLITLSGVWIAPVSVNYATVDGTATVADTDFVSTSGTVTFAVGETSKLVYVTIVGDSKPEQNETFQLVLSSPVNGILARANATGTITNDDGSPEPAFKIVVVFPDNTLTAQQKAVFTDAANRWSEIIVGDVPDVTFQGRVIDDLEISATAPAIDGPGQILGQAGPTEFRAGSSLPYLGIMQFDSADLALMAAQGIFKNVILHEMGHVLGIGTLWQDFNLVQGIGTGNPIYVGANAVREYQTLSGTTATSVPVENTGGPGTAGGHWRESVFDAELMTGYVAPGVSPISRMTVGTFEDMGYSVDYAAADPYTLNAQQAAINFQRQQLSGATPSFRMLQAAGGAASANFYAAVAFGAGTASVDGESIATRTFRAIGGVRT